MGRQKSLRYQVENRLCGMRAYGDSKHADKAANGGKPAMEKIYSHCTFKNYLDACMSFARWAKGTHGCRDLRSAEALVGEYLKHRMDSGCSSWTVRKDAAALGKLFQKKTTDFGVTLPKRHRSDITQHRGSTSASKFSEKRNRDLVDFCKATGLRRREVKALRTSDVWKTSDGCVLVHVRAGKGGKERIVQALNHRPLEIAAARTAVSGGGESAPLFDRVPIRTPIHMYRRDYAQELYRSLARPMDSLSRSEVYRCQRDMSGVEFDRQAMKTVSYMLGHNRLDVVTTYLKD